MYLFGGEDRARRAIADLCVLDLTSLTWEVPAVEGGSPSARSAHVAAAVDDRCDCSCSVIPWQRTHSSQFSQLPSCDTVGSPSIARQESASSSDGFDGRYLLIFGGGSVAHCFADLWLLDTETHTWSNPRPEGQTPAPRAGWPSTAEPSVVTASSHCLRSAITML